MADVYPRPPSGGLLPSMAISSEERQCMDPAIIAYDRAAFQRKIGLRK